MLLSLLPNIICILLCESSSVGRIFDGTISPAMYIYIILSIIFGYGMSTFNFYLQQSVPAAAVQVANIAYKLVLTIVSSFTHPVFVPVLAWIGYVISFTGIILYTFSNKIHAYIEEQSIMDIESGRVRKNYGSV